MQVALFLDPLLFVDQDAVHQRNLARRAAEPEAADLEPDAQRVGEGNGRGWCRVDAICWCVHCVLLQQPAELGRTGVLGPRESAIPRLEKDARDRGRVSTLPGGQARKLSERCRCEMHNMQIST